MRKQMIELSCTFYFGLHFHHFFLLKLHGPQHAHMNSFIFTKYAIIVTLPLLHRSLVKTNSLDDFKRPMGSDETFVIDDRLLVVQWSMMLLIDLKIKITNILDQIQNNSEITSNLFRFYFLSKNKRIQGGGPIAHNYQWATLFTCIFSSNKSIAPHDHTLV